MTVHSDSKRLPARIIDFHVHLFPDKLFDAIWEFFLEEYGWHVKYQMYYRECIEFLHQQNVERIVYSNYAHTTDVAGRLNEWNLETLDSYPDTYCFAAYHPDDENAVSRAEKLLDHPRILGFKLQLLVQRFYPHDERLFPLYETVMKRKKRILFHVGTGPIGNRFVGLAEFVKLLEKFPDLPANVAHMGGLEYREFMELLDSCPNLYLDTSFSFVPELKGKGAFNLDPDYLEKYRDRILYGSDFPNLIMPREAEIEALLNYDLSQDFYRKVFYENGNRLITQITDKD